MSWVGERQRMPYSNKNLVDIKKIKYLLFNAKGDNKVKIIGAGEAVSGRGKKSVGILS